MFLVVSELGRIFRIDDDKSWKCEAPGSRRRPRVDGFTQRRGPAGHRGDVVGRIGEVYVDPNLEDCSEIQLW